MKKIFPKAACFTEGEGCFKIDKKLNIFSECAEFNDAAEYFSSLASVLYGIKCDTVRSGADVELKTAELENEAYILDITNEKITAYAATKNGAIYALSTLIQLVKNDNGLYAPACHVEDKPYTEMRGVHFYLPGRDKIDSFKRIVDTMAFLKMNTVILEIGGGMQYD